MEIPYIKMVWPVMCILAISFLFQSCSNTEIEPDPTTGLTLISQGYATGAAAKVEMWAPQKLFAGYNPVFFVLYDSITGKRIPDSHIHLHPLMDMHTMTHSCPVEEPEGIAVDELFPGGILFTMPSGDLGSWTLEVGVHNHLNALSGKVLFDIDVQDTTPSRIISFVAGNGEKYYLSYYFPEKMKVGVNEFEVIAFTLKAGAFVPAENLNIILTPEMTSMGHGSPNNEDPIHTKGGHYAGKANFTMTGEWRLNLDIIDGETTFDTKYFDVIVK